MSEKRTYSGHGGAVRWLPLRQRFEKYTGPVANTGGVK